jgi:hypothetical protein
MTAINTIVVSAICDCNASILGGHTKLDVGLTGCDADKFGDANRR